MTATTSHEGMSITSIESASHEEIRYCHDQRTGLRAIVAIHDTTLGPALGGTRFRSYPDVESALEDARRLSEGMTYKAAVAGLDLGGGKAVIIGDPATVKTPRLLEAYGRFVDSLGGRYITACDVGTTSQDMDVISGTTRHVVARTETAGGLGDSGYSTAYGVFASLRAAVAYSTGQDDLGGVRVGVEGAGKVGSHLIGLLLDDGASVLFSEPNGEVRTRLLERHPGITHTESVLDADVDVYAPCALGATLSPSSAEAITARIVCGAANNQLADPGVEFRLAARGIVWVPDYVANAGGLVQVAVERAGGTLGQARTRIGKLTGFVDEILRTAAADAVTPGQAALRIAERRLRKAA
ncbi:Glu/Leu/Phe/Val family dehydrogenase [Prauserella endophytica]|uniref:Glu/Leu/Phe/Val dehydrogenase n=1 Tax=Prauserella endophytica TaxID=1592324 RepID=A0ABY2S9T0_9PSEU|nr:Glu/Leu/Phe/Val dehydrogenase dimerization domain-containing protein [Prauserella endophytica]TKG72441.1 Glu/Leu/Phe/Val dehydrogenase [Prauserella endophytica]